MEAGKSLLLVAPLHLLRLGLELQLVAVLDCSDLERRQHLHQQHLCILLLLDEILEVFIQLVPRCAQLRLQQLAWVFSDVTLLLFSSATSLDFIFQTSRLLCNLSIFCFAVSIAENR